MNLKKGNLRQFFYTFINRGSILLSKLSKEFRFFYLIHIRRDKSCKKICSSWYIKSIAVSAPTEASENLDWKEKYFDLQKQFIALQKQFFILEKQFRQSLVKLGISRIIAVTLCVGLITTAGIQYFLNFSKAATYDIIWPFTTAGDYTYDSEKIEVSGGLARLKNIATSEATYTAANGKIQNDNVNDVYVYDASTEMIKDPSDDFYGTTIDTNRWNEADPSNILTQNNKLTWDWNAGTSATAQIFGSSTWAFTGDFDVQFDFNLATWSAPGSGSQALRVVIYKDGDNEILFQRDRNSAANTYWSRIKIGGVEDSATTSATDASGKFRVARLGTTITCYYWNGTAWVNQNDNAGGFTGTTYLYIHGEKTSNVAVKFEIDNFKLNSGATTFATEESWRTHPLSRMSSWYNEPTDPTDEFNGTTIDTNRWTEYDASNILSQNGKLIWDYGAGTSATSFLISSDRWVFTDDFDVQFDFNLATWTAPGSGSQTLRLVIQKDDNNNILLQRNRDTGGQGYWSRIKIGGVDDALWTTVSDTSGKFRVTRIGANIICYYWNGSAWVNQNDNAGGFTGNVYVYLYGEKTSNVAVKFEVDNFRVNSGATTLTNAGNTNRSATSAFPEKAYLMANDGGLDIVDASDNSLWMKLAEGTNYAVPVSNHNAVYAYKGEIYLASDAQTTIIDLLRDRVKYHNSTNDYQSSLDTIKPILSRHTALTYATGPSGPIINSSSNNIFTKEISNKIYTVVSTAGGASVINETDNSVTNSSETGAMTSVYFDSANNLYYSSGTTLYKEATYTSNFTADSTITGLAGTVREINSNTNDLYVATADNITKITKANIAAGSQTLSSISGVKKYTESGGGGDYAVLAGSSGDCKSVKIDSSYMYVGTNDGAAGGALSIVDLSSNALYSRAVSPVLLSNNISSIDIDSSLKVIAGTDASGVSKIIYTTYPSDNPTIVNNTGVTYGGLTTFSETLGGGNTGSVKYQISNNGTDWYWYNEVSGDWESATGVAQTNTSSIINTNCNTFHSDIHPGVAGTFYFKSFLISDGTQEVELDNLAVNYSVNDAPELQTLTASQGADGLVNISYQVRDIDTNDGEEAHQGKVTISFQYWDGDEWQEATTTVGEGVKNIATSPQTDWTTYTGTWDPKTDYNNQYTANGMKIRVTANDLELVYNTATLESSTFELDTVNPASPSIKVNALTQYGLNAATLTLSATDSTMQSGVKGYMMISLDSGFSGASYQTYNTASTITLVDNPDTVYVKFKDDKGNVSATASVTTPQTPECIMTQDTSNVRIVPNEYRLFIAWEVIDDPPQGTFSKYSILRSTTTNDADFVEVGTVNVKTTNFYTDTTPDYNVLHYYKIVAYDSLNNISFRSNAITGKANGIQDSGEGGGGTDITAPTVSNVTSTDVYTSQATITWTTDEFSDSTVGYSTSEVLETFTYVNLPTMGTSHSLTLNGLTQNTPYYFLVKSEDPSSNETIDDNSDDYYTFTTLPGPTLTNVSVSQINNSTARITWLTDTSSNSYVVYSTSSNLSGSTTHGTETRVSSPNSEDFYEHSVEISSLTPGTRYYFYVKSYDISTNLGINDNASDYYFFNTTYDFTPPIINEVSASITAYTSTITWETDELSTSQVEYGLTDAYGTLSPSSVTTTDLTIDHVIKLSGLTVGSTYHFRVYSKDANNNESVSADYTFTPTREGDLTGPTISIPEVPSTSIFTNQATITWTTDELSDSTVEYSATQGVYSSSKNSSSMVTSHSVVLTGLSKDTTYYFRVKSEDAAENETTKSDNYSFSTKAGSIISNVIISSVVNEKVTVRWLTDTASDSKVVYSTTSNLSNPQQETDETLNTVHVINLTGLYPNVIYYFYVESTDGSANTAKDNNQGAYYYFTTADDQIDPVISLVNSSATAYTSTITWETDELSTSQLEYGTTTDYGTETDLDSKLTIQHVIHLTDLTNDRTYHFRVKSKDANNNESTSIDYSFITTEEPEAPDTTVPVISEVNSYPTETLCTITWKTDDLTTSQVEYGSTTAYGTSNTLNSTLTVEHVVRLTDLTSNQLYHYRVKSKNAADLETTSQDYTFTPQFVTQEVRVINAGGGGTVVRDETAPMISNVAASKITENSATVTWATDEKATGLIDYGLTSTYTDSQHAVLSSFTTSHQIILSDLIKGTVYHYKVLSQDASGNLKQGSDLIFTTLGSSAIPTVPEVTETEEIAEPEAEKTPEEKAQEIKKIEEQKVSQETFMTAVEMIKKISSTISLSAAENGFTEITSAFKGFFPGPMLEGSPGIEISATEAKIKWTTDRKANSVVAIAKVADFDKTKPEPYSQVVGQSSEYELMHNVNIINLTPSTDYFFQIRSKSLLGSETRSKQYTFTTTSQLPEVTNFSIKNISERAATFVWQTNIPTDSQVKYIPYRNNKLSPNEVQMISKSDSSITHEITVKNLEPGTTFNVSLEGKDLEGNNYSFLIPNFTTTKDKNAPIIAQIRTSVALSSRGDEVQTIITWNTDEPSNSQVEYQVGFANDAPIVQMSKDISLRQEHLVVITSFKPGSIYRFKVISEDSSGNKTESKTNTLLTPQKRLTVTELIFKNFQQTFGWMKGMGK